VCVLIVGVITLVLEARSRGTALATASFAAAERAPAMEEERREEGRGVWKPAVGFVMTECFGIGRDSSNLACDFDRGGVGNYL
jgi:hypothetical protein